MRQCSLRGSKCVASQDLHKLALYPYNLFFLQIIKLSSKKDTFPYTMQSSSQLVHVIQKKTGFTNLRSYVIKNLTSESQQHVQNLTSTFTQ